MKIYYLNQINTMTYSDKVSNFIFTSGVINKLLDSLLKRILTPLLEIKRRRSFALFLSAQTAHAWRLKRKNLSIVTT